MSETSTRFVIPVYPGTTQLDFTGPHQFFSRVPGAEVIVASRAGGELKMDGLTFAGLTKLADVPGCDVLCVPGGFGTVDAIHDSAFLDQVRRLAAGARFVTSVCTGSIILAAAGLLAGRRAACHWYWRDTLALFPGVSVAEDRVVRDGNVITGGGVTAGIDLALTVIAELAGESVAKSIQLGLEYAPQPPFDAGRPERAAAETVAALRRALADRTESSWQRIERFIADTTLPA
jgi:transcriptional regulator GlxA family with amidase domain